MWGNDSAESKGALPGLFIIIILKHLENNMSAL